MQSHYSAMARPGAPPLAERPFAPWLWRSLRRVFPDALACVLMPDHFHVIAPASPRRTTALSHALGRFGLAFAEGLSCFRPLEAPKPIAPGKVARNVRYVSLNPCRPTRRYGPLCDDPLVWTWCTHRDVLGATVDPWIDAERLAAALGDRRSNFAHRFHQYVSGDPDVDVAGTPPPSVAPATRVACAPLETILDAVASAMRLDVGSVQRSREGRRIFVHAAQRHGWRDRDALAAALACNPRTVSRCSTREVAESALRAVATCVADERLRRPTRTVPEEGQFGRSRP